MNCLNCGHLVERTGTRGPKPKFCNDLCSRNYRYRQAHPGAPIRQRGPAKRRFTGSLEARIMAYVQKTTTCWIWTGTVNPSRPRPQINHDGKPVSPAKVLWEARFGVSDGPLRARCQNLLCVNPDHRYVPKRPGGSRTGVRAEKFMALSEADRRATAEYIEVVQRDPCAYCGAPSETVDHVDAISRGGSASWTNLTAACGPCNTSKFTAPLLLSLLRGGDDQWAPRNSKI